MHKLDKYIFGIDPGVMTGCAFIDLHGKMTLASLPIHEAFSFLGVRHLKEDANFKVYVEDARKRRWYGEFTKGKAQGAGSVKRDCKIWEDLLSDYKKEYEDIDFEMIHPIKNATKLTHKQFCSITGWPLNVRTNEHKRDAGMIAFLKSGLNKISNKQV